MLALAWTPVIATALEQPHSPLTTHIVRADKKDIPLQLEIASTPDAREHGLMDRDTLKPYDGMAFWFPSVQPQAFWMKDTRIPLDILFVGDDNRIRSIAHGMPMSLERITSNGPIESVIELDGGRAAKEGIAVGDFVAYEIQVEPTNLAR